MYFSLEAHLHSDELRCMCSVAHGASGFHIGPAQLSSTTLGFSEPCITSVATETMSVSLVIFHLYFYCLGKICKCENVSLFWILVADSWVNPMPYFMMYFHHWYIQKSLILCAFLFTPCYSFPSLPFSTHRQSSNVFNGSLLFKSIFAMCFVVLCVCL